jgi:PAS domain S-box-containing protein
MDMQDHNPNLYKTKPPSLFEKPETDSDRMVLRSRLTGIVTLVVNIAMIAVVAYIFIQFDIPGQSPVAAVGFAILVMIYGVLSASLVLILNRSVMRSALQREVLQSMVSSYQRRTDELQLAAQVARDASTGTNLTSILQEAVQLVHERFGFYHAAIYLIEEFDDGKYAVMRSAAGSTIGSRSMVEAQYRIQLTDRSIITYVIENAKARVVLDVKQDKQYTASAFLPDTRSELVVPLQVTGMVMGVFDVQSRKEGAFSQQDVIIMQTLADLLAVAIHKAHLHQEIKQHAQQLEYRVQERTQQLATERAQLNAILDAMVEGVVYYQDDEIKYINRAFTELMGYSRTDWEGITLMMRVSKLTEGEVSKLREIMDEDLERKGMWRGEITMRRKDGVEFEAHITATTLDTDATGNDSGTVVIIRDISQEKALQEQKSRFVAYASHELRTPLANIKTRLYLLNKQRHLFDKHYNIILEVTGRMQRLVDDLLAKSRFDRGLIELNCKVTSLNELLTNVVELQQPEAEKKAMKLILTLPDKPLMASVDDDRMTQVFTNLVSNAINYTDNGGKITVTLKTIDDSTAEINVADTGIGIPPQMMDDIFNPFVRADNSSAKGTGLGLNITKQIVELHGGEISVTSELNKGSVFTVRLKLAPQESSTGAAD